MPYFVCVWGCCMISIAKKKTGCQKDAASWFM